MYAPVKPEELKIVQGHSGRGLQVTCACGCANWNHLEMNDPIWKCRNCGRDFTHTYPLLVKKFMATQTVEDSPAPPAAPAVSSKESPATT